MKVTCPVLQVEKVFAAIPWQFLKCSCHVVKVAKFPKFLGEGG